MKRSASVLADISMWDVIKIGNELLERKNGVGWEWDFAVLESRDQSPEDHQG